MRQKTDQELSGHFILCGLGHVGYRIAELLHNLGESFVVITRDIRPEWRDTLVARAALFVEGDARAEANLRAAGIETARALFIVTDNDLINTEIALDAGKLNPELPVIVRIFDLYLAERVDLFTNVRCVLSPAMLTAPVFVAAAFGEEHLRVFDIEDCPLHVLRLPLSERLLLPADTIASFCTRHNLIPLALRRKSEASEPAEGDAPLTPDTVLASGDELIVVDSGSDADRLLGHSTAARQTQEPALPYKHFAFRAGRRASLSFTGTFEDVWRHAPPILRQAFLGLCLFIMLSTVIIHNCMPGDLPWVDSLYFVITIMTTVGFGDYSFKEAPAWLKLYGCGMMISGALLVAILFGIVTDYIVTLRVEQTLGRLPTRQTGHVVVIGLGDVGSRVAEMLHRLRVPVIAIERTPEHEAVPTLQDKIHVIIADANREGTMRQANIPRARAVVVTTTSDLDSLRIAHLAETLNANIRAVVRIYDSALARKLGSSFRLETVVNAAETAAATFVSSALQKDVEQGFALGNRLLLLRWVQPDEVEAAGMVNKTVRDLRAAGHAILLKSSRVGEQQKTHPVTPGVLIHRDDTLLVLEEYDPTTDCCRPPHLTRFHEEMTL